jgi:histidyl-tRNA synthetase
MCLDGDLMGHYHDIADELRSAGLRADVYPEPRKLGQQYAFAEKKGITAAILCDAEQRAAGVVTVRDLSTRTNAPDLNVAKAASRIHALAGQAGAST